MSSQQPKKTTRAITGKSVPIISTESFAPSMNDENDSTSTPSSIRSARIDEGYGAKKGKLATKRKLSVQYPVTNKISLGSSIAGDDRTNDSLSSIDHFKNVEPESSEIYVSTQFGFKSKEQDYNDAISPRSDVSKIHVKRKDPVTKQTKTAPKMLYNLEATRTPVPEHQLIEDDWRAYRSTLHNRLRSKMATLPQAQQRELFLRDNIIASRCLNTRVDNVALLTQSDDFVDRLAAGHSVSTYKPAMPAPAGLVSRQFTNEKSRDMEDNSSDMNEKSRYLKECLQGREDKLPNISERSHELQNKSQDKHEKSQNPEEKSQNPEEKSQHIDEKSRDLDESCRARPRPPVSLLLPVVLPSIDRDVYHVTADMRGDALRTHQEGSAYDPDTVVTSRTESTRVYNEPDSVSRDVLCDDVTRSLLERTHMALHAPKHHNCPCFVVDQQIVLPQVSSRRLCPSPPPSLDQMPSQASVKGVSEDTFTHICQSVRRRQIARNRSILSMSSSIFH